MKESTLVTIDAPATALQVDFVVNEIPCRVELGSDVTLLDALRDHLGLVGTKKGLRPGNRYST